MAERIVVVQLDVNKAFDHVDHRAAFKAMRLQGVSPLSTALIAAIWNGSTFGNGSVEQSPNEQTACLKGRQNLCSSSQ